MYYYPFQNRFQIPDYTLTVKSVTSNAAANGIATNSFTVRLSTGDVWVYNALINFVVDGGAFFTANNFNRIDVLTNNQGEATVFFANANTGPVRVTASFSSDVVWRDTTFGPPASDADFEIESEVLTHDIEAGSGIPHTIRYTLFNALKQTVSGARLNYSVDGDATLTPPIFDITNFAGRTELNVFKPTPGSVSVYARLDTAPSIVFSLVRLTFTESVLTQRIIAQVLTDGAPANGSSQNIVRFRIINIATLLPVSGAEVITNVIGNALPTTLSRNTDGNGYVTFTWVNSSPQDVRIVTTLASGLGNQNDTFLRFN